MLEYYIKIKENDGEGAKARSADDVTLIKDIFYTEAKAIVEYLKLNGFYASPLSSLEESIKKIKLFRHHLEDRDNYKIFWDGDELKKIREDDIGILLDLIFNDSLFSIDKQPNNGRGPADIKVSMGSRDSTIIEIKLASNKQMPKNLRNQLDIYKKANGTYNGIYLIVYFSRDDKSKIDSILRNLKMEQYLENNIFLIDCTKKTSASKA